MAAQWVERATRPFRPATRRPEPGTGMGPPGRPHWLEPGVASRPAGRRTTQAGGLCHPRPSFQTRSKAGDHAARATTESSVWCRFTTPFREFMQTATRLRACLKRPTPRRVRAPGLQEATEIAMPCRPGALTGRVFKQALSAGAGLAACLVALLISPGVLSGEPAVGRPGRPGAHLRFFRGAEAGMKPEGLRGG